MKLCISALLLLLLIVCVLPYSSSAAEDWHRHAMQHFPSTRISALLEDRSFMPQDDSGTCEYPCFLNNGCKCNGTLIHNGPDTTWQNYGTCTWCYPGWGGFDCSTIIQDCYNGGHKNGTKCVCQLGWRGAQCGDLECLHSKGGTGPEAIAPPNPDNNSCSGICSAGWNGLACELCTKNEQCGPGKRCSNSLIAEDTSKDMLCEITDQMWVYLMGDGRDIKPFIRVQFNKTNGWSNSSTDGIWFMSMWRQEPQAAWLDPFFYCKAQNCSMFLSQDTKPGEVGPVPKLAKTLRLIFSIILYVCCFIIALNGIIKVRQQERIFFVTGAAIVCVLIAAILFSTLYGHTQVTPPTHTDTVSYVCSHSSCGCAENPPNWSYTPRCGDSIMGMYYLPMMKHGSKLTCDYSSGSGNCSFTHKDLGDTPIPLKCTAAECARDNVPPPNVVPEGQISAAIAGEVVAVATLLCITGFLSHRAYTNWAFKKLRRLFDALYLDGPSVVNPPQVEYQPLLNKQSSTPSTPHSEMVTPRREEDVAEQQQQAMGCVLYMHGAGFSINGGSKVILDDISLTVCSGETLALMGPSGAGKTTLLDLLALRPKSGAVCGKLFINGEEITPQSSSIYKRMIGYVGQEENLIPALTVRQTIWYAARLKLPSPISDIAVRELVEETLVKLSLTHCADTKVGDEWSRGISGGEKRRVSIGAELVANPRILFLDEPTSGLDSVSAYDVMRCLAKLSRKGNVRVGGDGDVAAQPKSATGIAAYTNFFSFHPIVIFSIHQPSADIYELFDRVIFLDSGRVTYFGPAAEAVAHMKKVVGAALEETTTAAANAEAPPPPPSGVQSIHVVHAHSLSDTSGSPTSTTFFPEVPPVPVNYSNPAEALMRLQRVVGRRGIDMLVACPSPDSQVERDTALHRRLAAERAMEGLSSTGGGGTCGTVKGASLTGSTAEWLPQNPSAAAEKEKAVQKKPKPTILQLTAENQKYYPNAWQQLHLLAGRTWASLMGSYYLLASHAAASVFLGVVLSFMYYGQKLDLAGTENKAGMITFLLLIVAFQSLSCLELFIAERGLFTIERDNGYYNSMPYFVIKIAFDFIPLRIVPNLLLAACIYFPMGLRDDQGQYFVWFLTIIMLFTLFVTATCVCVAMVAPSFGSAALFSALLILWNTAFGGLMIRSETIPSAFVPFKYSSPFYYAFESLMINELDGLNCVFDPANSEGQSAGVEVPILCRQFLYNLGLEPHYFNRDVSLLVAWVFATVFLALMLLIFVVRLRG